MTRENRDWKWENGEARRGPVRLRARECTLRCEWSWSVAVNAIERAGHADTETAARRAAEEAAEAFAREVAEAFGYVRAAEHGQCDECGSRWNEDHRNGCEVGVLSRKIHADDDWAASPTFLPTEGVDVEGAPCPHGFVFTVNCAHCARRPQS